MRIWCSQKWCKWNYILQQVNVERRTSEQKKCLEDNTEIKLDSDNKYK